MKVTFAVIATATSLSLLAAACSSAASTATPVLPAPIATATSMPNVRREISLFATPRPSIVATIAALQKNDIPGAKTAWEPYNYIWNGVEVYIQHLDLAQYRLIEVTYEAGVTTALWLRMTETMPCSKRRGYSMLMTRRSPTSTLPRLCMHCSMISPMCASPASPSAMRSPM